MLLPRRLLPVPAILRPPHTVEQSTFTHTQASVYGCCHPPGASQVHTHSPTCPPGPAWLLPLAFLWPSSRAHVLQLNVKLPLLPPSFSPGTSFDLREKQGDFSPAPLPYPLPHPEIDNHFLGQVRSFKGPESLSPLKGKPLSVGIHIEFSEPTLKLRPI